MLQNYKQQVIIIFLYAVSMAYLESAVVVYLRLLYYPKGFSFPLKNIPSPIFFIEIGREIATVIMLWAIAKLSSKNNREWFAFFCLSFAIWDIWYYIWLKIFLNWPVSFLDRDILFLIPSPWIAPVLAPLLVSISLIFAAIIILKIENSGKTFQFNSRDWLFEVLCGLLIILSFMTELKSIEAGSIPEKFSWWLFLIGWLAGIGWFSKKTLFDKNK